MARTLSQIVAELNQGSQGQIDILKKKQAGVAGKREAGAEAVEGKRRRANESILTGARRRGLGFSGIPLGEQAKYAADVYAPALLSNSEHWNDYELGLAGQLANIYSANQQSAQNIYQQEQARAEQIRQFNENLAFQREQAEKNRATQRAATAWMNALGAQTTSSSSTSVPTTALQQAAYNDVATRVGQQSDQELWSDYLATASSAKYGNQKDLAKLQIYRSMRPDLFKRAYSWEK